MSATSNRLKRYAFYTAIAFCINQFLFYLDEGYHDFRWMKQPGNWIAFFIYMALLLGFMLLADLIVQRFYKGKGKILIGSIVGLILLLITVFGVAKLVAA